MVLVIASAVFALFVACSASLAFYATVESATGDAAVLGRL